MRDLTKREFRKKCSEYGFKPMGFLGYFDLGLGRLGGVSVHNAGSSYRAQLAYLIRMQAEGERRKQ
jgi:hypothetical protein